MVDGCWNHFSTFKTWPFFGRKLWSRKVSSTKELLRSWHWGVCSKNCLVVKSWYDCFFRVIWSVWTRRVFWKSGSLGLMWGEMSKCGRKGTPKTAAVASWAARRTCGCSGVPGSYNWWWWQAKVMSLSSLHLGHGSLEKECWVNFHPPKKIPSILEIFSNLLNKICRWRFLWWWNSTRGLGGWIFRKHGISR